MTKSRVLMGAALLLSVFVISSCGGGSSGGGGGAKGDEIFLNAFTDFTCSPGWANRDGALGRVAYSGSGTCSAPFPGPSGVYAVLLKAQTEFDGASPYSVSLNGEVIGEGTYPYSSGTLKCSCNSSKCPDAITNLAVGIYKINTDDIIEFFGDDVYPCGRQHGAYAKWHGLIFIRQ